MESRYEEKVPESALDEFHETCRAAWPDIALDPEPFLKHVTELISQESDPVEALRRLHGSDLYLACACISGHPRAIAIFEKTFFARVSAYLRRGDTPDWMIDEVTRDLREKLLVGAPNRAPKLASYTGRGPLAGWLRICAARARVDLFRKTRAERGEPLDEKWELQPGGPDPELEHLKARYGGELKSAFQSALASLPAREAGLLKLYFFEGVSTDALGKMYRVHARTVQRWIEGARKDVLEKTRRMLIERLGLDASELDSLFDLVVPDLEISISRILGRNSGYCQTRT